MNPIDALDDLASIETGFARIYRNESEVYKIRKPVALLLDGERLDFSHPTARRTACLEELAVARRLETDVALEVVPVARDETGRLIATDRRDEGTKDWALRMRRLPDADRASDRLAANRLTDDHLRAVARRIAAFHERERGDHEPADSAIARLRRWITMHVESPAVARGEPVPPEFAHAEAWQLDFLERESARLIERAERAAVREGHGELTLEHVFVDDLGGVRLLAGLEVFPLLRNVDAAADVAFFATDLASRRRADLAERFVAEYARLANDFDLYPLLDFHASLRASIRAKLDWLSADLATTGTALESRYRERARRFAALALAQPRRPLLPPMVVAMGGQVASGKSTVARHVAHRIGAPVVGSDPTRDFLIGGRLNEDLHEARWDESYAPGFGEKVYAEVLRRAGEVLASGRPVVIDGCFRSRAQRARARDLAERHGLPFLFVEAQVSRNVQRTRLAQRALRDDVPIDDWVEIADHMRAQWEPADDLAATEVLALDTSQPLEHNTQTLEDHLLAWPPALTD